MRIKDIFPNNTLDDRLKKLEITGINDDSRTVQNGELFFIIDRENFDIFSILKSIEDKVSVFIGEKNQESKIKNYVTKKPVIFVNNVREKFYKSVDSFYEFPKNKCKFIGVTGTNGKTTTTHIIYYLLKSLGKNASLLGTVNYRIGNALYKATHTTPDFLTLRKLFKEMNDKKVEFIVMEVSSHGIEQERIGGIKFNSCVFTNLSRDHLDYHNTMSEYFKVKQSFFLSNKGVSSIINIDNRYGRELLKKVKNALSYGLNKGADLSVKNLQLSKRETCFDMVYNKEVLPVETAFLGQHNVSNILAATAALISLGFSFSEIIKFIPLLNSNFVDGRLEEIVCNIFVDYAHTPDALEKVICTLRKIGYKKVICVFGCGGDRDKGKRKIMGKAAGDFADYTFITSDNPRSEEPKKICLQIEKGFKNNNYSVVIDREEAIRAGVKLLMNNHFVFLEGRQKSETCLLVAGKGHEDYQILKDKRIEFKDSVVIRKIINELGIG